MMEGFFNMINLEEIEKYNKIAEKGRKIKKTI